MSKFAAQVKSYAKKQEKRPEEKLKIEEARNVPISKNHIASTIFLEMLIS